MRQTGVQILYALDESQDRSRRIWGISYPENDILPGKSFSVKHLKASCRWRVSPGREVRQEEGGAGGQAGGGGGGGGEGGEDRLQQCRVHGEEEGGHPYLSEQKDQT